ncbi:MAG: DUF5680 domain-containing protein [bacterium]|nr:DUF5680 domain-containing protein [bacterium]
MNNNSIDLNNLAQFLDEANKNTFANKNAEKAAPTRLGSSDYHFEKGNLTYHDTYFGDRDFIGEEIVYRDQEPIWGMNYFGFMLSDNVSAKEVGSFLEESIMQRYDNVIPVRGPLNFFKDKWVYKLSINGGLDRFSGQEEISYNHQLVYSLFLRGGLLR